jgi:hypothetical protein
MRGYNHYAPIPRNDRNFCQTSDAEELENASLYKLHQGSPPRRLSFAMSPGCQQGSVPEELVAGQDIPRSIVHNFDSPGPLPYSFSMFNTQSDAKVLESDFPPRYDNRTNLQPKPPTKYRGSMDGKYPTNHHGLNPKDPLPAKQYAGDSQNIPAGYRQFDIYHTTEENAETDEDASQEPYIDEDDCHQN